MKTLIALFLAGACSAVSAQIPTTNPMPDGSRDAYIGLGVVSAPDYLGADQRRVRALPLIQLQTSSGLFISGMSAGWHLSSRPALEFGPLVALHPGRNAAGDRNKAGGIDDAMQGFSGVRPDESALIAQELRRFDLGPHQLDGLTEIKPRLQGGAFLNVYLTPGVRLVSSVLYGAGNGRDGLAATVAVQHLARQIAPHHAVTLSAGLTLVNRRHNQAFFGIDEAQSLASGYDMYAPRGGVRDVFAGAGWNWALSPSWIVTSNARVTLLKGDARHSPLTRRSGGLTVSTGLAYRF